MARRKREVEDHFCDTNVILPEWMPSTGLQKVVQDLKHHISEVASTKALFCRSVLPVVVLDSSTQDWVKNIVDGPHDQGKHTIESVMLFCLFELSSVLLGVLSEALRESTPPVLEASGKDFPLLALYCASKFLCRPLSFFCTPAKPC